MVNTKWKIIGMRSNWFDLTRILLVDGDKRIEVCLGCRMCGYTFKSSIPCVVCADTPMSTNCYDEEILPRAENIIKHFLEEFDLDSLYVQVLLNNKVDLNWYFNDGR